MKVDETRRDWSKLGSPYIIGKYEDFKSRPFDDLYGWASAPRHPDQTKIGKEETNNKNKQYG